MGLVQEIACVHRGTATVYRPMWAQVAVVEKDVKAEFSSSFSQGRMRFGYPVTSRVPLRGAWEGKVKVNS